ncbi:MAG: ABC transporter permease [Acidimicrobiales bacterium]|mgnify:CR=1 FL=1|nr:ABC transporter permease [Acidimicrobiales bacterium]MDP6299012.1 ABC transporter permease [Acidimicrobiales bacterium]HJM27514.1 ABC transporter permease [Acidimicrobiales bacterium]
MKTEQLKDFYRSGSYSWLIPPISLLAIQQVFWRTPYGGVLQGVVLGLITSLVALGIVLTYRSNRVLNFAQGELGLLPTVLSVMLIVESGFPYIAAFAIGLAAAALLGVSSEFLVIRRFSRSPRLILTVATLGLAQILVLCALLMPDWWGSGVTSQRIDSPLNIQFDFDKFRFNDNHVIVVIIVPLVLMAVGLLLHRTRIGVGIRAIAEDFDRAGMLGIPVRRLQSFVWSLATVLAFLALFLRSSIYGLPVGGQLGVLFFLRALTAAVVGKLTDLKTVLATSVVLGVLQQGIMWNSGSPMRSNALMAAMCAGVILLALIVRRQTYSRFDNLRETLSMGETRPIPPELRSLKEVRIGKVVIILLFAAFLIMIPYWFGIVTILRISSLFVYAIVMISLVVLTGWGGQISLGQMAFFAAGAAIAAKMIIEWNLDLIPAVIFAGVFGALLSLLVGLPALRIRGLFLAVTTFAFELAMMSYFLNGRFFDWLPSNSERVDRLPILGRIDYTSSRGIYFVTVVALLLTLGAVHGLRQSRTGRVLVALRDNEQGVAAYGVSVMKAKLMAFAIAGFFAGAAGALYVVHQQSFGGLTTNRLGNSIRVFIAAIVGGIGSTMGAMIGSLFLFGTIWWLRGDWSIFATGFGVLTVLLIAPGGISSLLYRFRDWLLTLFAFRRDINVPSLIADDQIPDAPPKTVEVDNES